MTPEHKNKADIRGLNNIYKELGTIQSTLLMHIDDLRGKCSCGDSLASAAINISASKDAIGDVINRHHK